MYQSLIDAGFDGSAECSQTCAHVGRLDQFAFRESFHSGGRLIHAGKALDGLRRFSLSAFSDFFLIGKEILVIDKAAFESILSYKAGA
jgi:hypothetical protein